MELRGDSVTHLYNEMLGWANSAPHEEEMSRLGKVRVMDRPLTICNVLPQRRVLFDAKRNANPFFHLMESIWMMGGGEDDWIIQFNSNMANYIQSSGLFHGAYGYRWKHHFEFDQVKIIIDMLRVMPNTRRAYLGMWDPVADLGSDALDLPCNTGMAFQLRNGLLNGYVHNRSNDLIWGMLGANAVHFSFLLEVVAECARLPLGHLYQTTANPHLYEQHWPLVRDIINYDVIEPQAQSLRVHEWSSWTADCQTFLVDGPDGEYTHDFIAYTVAPMYRVYIGKDHGALKDIEAPDWALAAKQWVERNRS